MAKKTVLEYVQAALSVMDSDEVDAIDDTTESTQIAELSRDLYFELINRQDWAFLKRAVTLTAAGDSTQPTRFDVQDGLRHLDKFWYNVSTSGGNEKKELIYLNPSDFSTKMGSGGSNQLVTFNSQVQFYVATDIMPTHYTTFGDSTIFCDAFDSSIESSLVTSKVSGYGLVIPDYSVTDTFVPDLPEYMVPLFQATINACASIYFKQAASPVDEVRAKRQLSQARLQNAQVEGNDLGYYTNQYGRR